MVRLEISMHYLFSPIPETPRLPHSFFPRKSSYFMFSSHYQWFSALCFYDLIPCNNHCIIIRQSRIPTPMLLPLKVNRFRHYNSLRGCEFSISNSHILFVRDYFHTYRNAFCRLIWNISWTKKGKFTITRDFRFVSQGFLRFPHDLHSFPSIWIFHEQRR